MGALGVRRTALLRANQRRAGGVEQSLAIHKLAT